MKLLFSNSLILIGLFVSNFETHAQVFAKVDTALVLKSLPRPLPPFENITLHRIQFRITTATQEGCENDEGVYIQMNQGDEKFYLARGIDNFERGHTDTYDFISPTINQVQDIQFLRIGVKGDDGWRMRKIELFLNDNDYPVFSKDYGYNGLLLDNAASITIPSSNLRAYVGWKYTNNNRYDISKVPQFIAKNTLVSMVEAVIGDQLIRTKGFGWGTTSRIDNTRWGPVVEASYKNNKTLHFDLDIQRFLTGPNPEVDVDFDLEFSCDNNALQFEVKNVSFGTNWVGEAQDFVRKKGSEILGTAIGSFLGEPVFGAAAGGLLGKFLDYGINFTPQGVSASASCKNASVLPIGDIKLY